MSKDRRVLCACGILFVPNNWKQVRCNACRFPSSQVLPGPHRFCLRCGQAFSPNGSRDVYCSEGCHKVRAASPKPCAHCGTVFTPITNQRYCAACQPTATVRARKRLHLADRPCVMCGTSFTPWRRDQLVCSPACKQRRFWAQRTPDQKRMVKLGRVLRKHGKTGV